MKPSSMEHRSGVARAHVHAADTGIVRISIAITSEQGALRSLLSFVALRVNPAAHVIDLVVLEAEHVNHALAVDEDIVASAGRVLTIGAYFIERALESRRDRTLRQFETTDLALRAHRLAPTTIQLDIGKSDRLDHVCSSRESGCAWRRSFSSQTSQQTPVSKARVCPAASRLPARARDGCGRQASASGESASGRP